MVRLLFRVYSESKAGNQSEENEDAYCYNEETKRLAISDGASDSFEPRLWSRALAESYVSKPPVVDMEEMLTWLKSPIDVWRAQITWEQLPWYGEEKARRGAFATLLGITFSSLNEISPSSREDIADGDEYSSLPSVQWQAIAVGDSCLFHIRDGQAISRFPLLEISNFGTIPPLLSSRQDYNRLSLKELRTDMGICQVGDMFILTTDALSEWIVGKLNADEQPWDQLISLSDRKKFLEFVEPLRQDKTMRNDDVTIVLVWVKEEDSDNAETAITVVEQPDENPLPVTV